MRAPYKYPYLSIFILSYYFLEHEGYYYKLRNYFGYSVDDKINYVLSITSENSGQILKAPGRKSVICYWKKQETHDSETFKKLARDFKEKFRSPLIFGEYFCTQGDSVCSDYSSSFLGFYNEGNLEKVFSGEFNKRKIKKSIREFNK